MDNDNDDGELTTGKIQFLKTLKELLCTRSEGTPGKLHVRGNTRKSKAS